MDFIEPSSVMVPADRIADPANIPERVKLHTQTAYTLALMERRPPGYDEKTWALYLMDKTAAELRQRLIDRAHRERERIGEVCIQTLAERPMSVLPAIPERVPDELIPKMCALDRAWTEDWFKQEVERRLVGLITGRQDGRQDAAVLRLAATAVQGIVGDYRQRVGTELPFRAKVEMAKNGTINIILEARK
jgi:hypothetical protein